MEKVTKEEIKKLMELPGKIKGVTFNGDLEFILIKKGKEGVKKVEEETAKLGYLIEYEKMKETEWYPAGLRMVSIQAIFNTFGWEEKELIEMAEAAPKTSFLVRFFMKYFLSPEEIFQQAASRMWKRYYSLGSLEALDFKVAPKSGQALLRVRDFNLHPLHCLFLGNFFIGVFKLADPDFKKINFEEIKCSFKGDDCHEFLIKWEK